jgi:alpha-tubulin suppressor-like RCC1 family protein
LGRFVSDGQLGHDKCRTRPEKVEGLEHCPVVTVSVGYAHNIAVDKWGTVYAWGSDSHGEEIRFYVEVNNVLNLLNFYAGQLGLQREGREDKLVNRPRMVKSLSSKVCILYIYFDFERGNAILLVNVSFHFLQVVVQVAAGHFHSMVLTNSGEIYTCGSNSRKFFKEKQMLL